MHFHPLKGPLQLHQQVVEVEDGEVEEGELEVVEGELEVEEGGHSVGGWEELWLSESLLQLSEAGYVENLYTWCGREGSGIDEGVC